MPQCKRLIFGGYIPLLFVFSLCFYTNELSAFGETQKFGLLTTQNSKLSSKIPCILDTDIGDDIDDTWALAFLLKCPELDIRLITTCTGNTGLRAKMIAKTLKIFGREDIPIGIGKVTNDENKHKYFQKSWIADFDMNSYSGTVYKDGVDAMIQTIMNSKESVKVIAIGPLPNLAEALRREPRIVDRSEFVGMQGSIYIGYYGKEKPMPEWNVRTYIEDCRSVFNSDWKKIITPLDTCGQIQIAGEDYKKIINCKNSETQAVIDAYRMWLSRPGFKPEVRWDADDSTTILYDTVAIYLAISTEWCEMKELGLKVDDRGSTIVDDNAKTLNCAIKWKDKDAFVKLFIDRMIENN